MGASFFGGMTNLDGLAKSSTNRLAGAYTKLSVLVIGLLITFFVFNVQYLDHLPYFALAIIMAFVGIKMVLGLLHVATYGPYAVLLAMVCGGLVFQVGIFEGLIITLIVHALISYVIFSKIEGMQTHSIVRQYFKKFKEDEQEIKDYYPEFFEKLPSDIGLTLIRNKADLNQALVAEGSNNPIGLAEFTDKAQNTHTVVTLSAKTGIGVDSLKEHLKTIMGYQGSTEGGFMARRRHLTALDNSHQHLITGLEQLESYVAGEILAEELRLCQLELDQITGEFTSDDLLSKIFSSFCIGK